MTNGIFDEPPIEVFLSEQTDSTASFNIESLVDSTLVTVYLKESVAVPTVLPIFKDNKTAQVAGLATPELYFDWRGICFNVRTTNIILNLARFVSYLRRVF